MRLLDARAATVADKLGVEHLDSRPVLTPSLEHYYDYVHYTPAGAAVVARAVAAAFLRRAARGGGALGAPAPGAGAGPRGGGAPPPGGRAGHGGPARRGAPGGLGA